MGTGRCVESKQFFAKQSNNWLEEYLVLEVEMSFINLGLLFLS